MTAAAIAACAILAGGHQPQSMDYVTQCQQEVQGIKILVSSTIKTHRKELYPKLYALDLRAFCPCYHSKVRGALGTQLYERSQTLKGISELTDAEVMRVNDAADTSIIACVEAQLAPDTGPSYDDHYSRFVRSTVMPGMRVGGLQVGGSQNAMFAVLGPTKTVKRTEDGGAEYYYGPNADGVVVLLSRAGTIRRISLNYRFAGQIEGGGRMGDSREKIRRGYPGKLAVDVPDYLVYCDGATFGFSRDRLQSISLAELTADPFAGDRRAFCTN